MTRLEKESFIREAWEHFETPADSVEMPILSMMNDNQINAMVISFEWSYQEEKTTVKKD